MDVAEHRQCARHARRAARQALFDAIRALYDAGKTVTVIARERLKDVAFIVGVAASILTGILATVSAFTLSLPDRSRLYALLPMPSLIVWLSTVSVGCLTNWVSVTPGGVQLGEAVSCVATLVLTSLPLSLALLVMLRYAAPLRPIAVTWMGSHYRAVEELLRRRAGRSRLDGHRTCDRLARLAHECATGAAIPVRRGCTYLAMAGPQFSSLAESRIYRSWGCDVIGMTNMPEAKLAREAEMCFLTAAMVTDFDCWHPDHAHVQVADVVRVLSENAENAKLLIRCQRRREIVPNGGEKVYQSG